MLKLYKKKEIVNDINKLFHKSVSIIFIDLFQMDANSLTLIRKICNINSCIAKIVKKTLILFAIKNTKYEKFFSLKYISNSNLMIFSFNEIGLITRELIKNNEINKILFANFAITHFKSFISTNVLLDLITFPTHLEMIIKFNMILKKISIFLFINILLNLKK